MSRLRTRSRVIEPTIWIGKEGVSTHLIQHVENQLKSRELVKVKLQKTALTAADTSSIAERMATVTDSILVDVLGHTFTLYKKKREIAKTMRGRSTRKSDVLC